MLAIYNSNLSSLTQSIAVGIAQLNLLRPDDLYTVDDVDVVLAKLNENLQFAKAEIVKIKVYAAQQEHSHEAERGFVASKNLQKLVLEQELQITSLAHKRNSQLLAGNMTGNMTGNISGNISGHVEDQNATLERSANRLQGVKQTLVDVNDDADTISTELLRNRQTLRGVDGKVHGTQSELKGASRILNRMFVRNVAQRASIFGIIAIGGAIILLVLIACLSTFSEQPTLHFTTIAPATTKQQQQLGS